MKAFIFKRIDEVSSRWHSEGGLVVIAENVEQAKKEIAKDICITVTESEWAEVETYNLVGNPEPKVFTFPDSGCC